ncbi:stage II sporulation protein P [Cohnella sp. WQ 127256]|uniref:stage II sporulation protein P n=1 Tax=Cohnella sp. WQ 127256 TaxID=2938790 RepID=UPI0021199EBE|nr:stage II sporulation protein P [Cohnella sp. WQ 127256]
MFLRKTLVSGTALALLLCVGFDLAYGATTTKPPITNTNVSLDNKQNDPIDQIDSSDPKDLIEQKAQNLVGAVVNIVDTTNLRSGPGIDHEVVGKAKPGDSFPVVGAEGDWYNIPLPSGETAYVASWVVNLDIPIQFAHIVENTNLRIGPGTDYEIVAKAKLGDSFQIVGTEGEWYQVLLPSGDNAYVASWIVKTNSTEQQSQNKVYIYQTHNRESWKNVASNTKGSSFDDPIKNISLVGKRLGEALQKRGIPTLVGQDDFADKLKVQNLNYSLSYSESRKAVNKAKAAHPSLTYFFDIHRDANVPRKDTTVKIKGKDYARILFVIGTAHPNYAENKKLATALSERLNKKYPGLSRGVLTKSKGNGEYNQSISPGSLLLEIGSVNNTLEESLLSAEAFSDIFTEYYGSLK